MRAARLPRGRFSVGQARTLLLRLASAAEVDLRGWRAGALEVLARVLPFDRALFHELSPRASLERAAVVGIDLRALTASLPRWDADAVELGRLRELALEQRGAVTDLEAFPHGSRGRAAWARRVARPLGLGTALLGHLVVHERIVAVVLLGRRARSSAHAFTETDRHLLAKLLPALAVGDALLQALSPALTSTPTTPPVGERARPHALGGPRTRLACVDQRLTPRQREVVVLVALGHTNETIGAALRISPNTVRNLLVQVRARLGVANRAEIVRVAVLR